jgi:hypothetical protein
MPSGFSPVTSSTGREFWTSSEIFVAALRAAS